MKALFIIEWREQKISFLTFVENGASKKDMTQMIFDDLFYPASFLHEPRNRMEIEHSGDLN